jgi:mono/diheme cytochrome c family protein
MVLARLAHGSALLACGLMLLVGCSGAGRAADLEAGRRVYEKANCVGCHKWHGGGGGGYGGAALSLRETALDREQLIEVVRCGRPGTRMPYHDRDAYRTTECYGGLTKADLGADFPPKAAAFLRREEIEAVVAYVTTRVQGHGDPTKEDCIAFWGQSAKECESTR